MNTTAQTSSLIEAFARYARVAGAEMSVVPDQWAAAQAIAADALAVRFTRAALAACPALGEVLQASDIAEEVAAQTPDRSALAAALAGETGVIVACAGVAETGSLILADDALAPRLLSMLADRCMVLLPAAAILPDLDAAALLLQELNTAGHRYVSLVTGPSRTADIERVLTIGVQGPKQLRIIILAEDQAYDAAAH